MPRTFVLASRASELAQIQTNIVLSKLKEKYPEAKFGTKFMSTGGDKNQTQALYLLGGKALWTKELEEALIEGEVDMVVHSLKDVPTKMPFGCVIGGVLDREDPVDSLVVRKGERWMKMEDMPDGSVIGTSSVRRVAQLRRMYPNVKFLDIRGNLNTRIAKLDAADGPYTALILARAGLVRLGLGERISSDLGPPILYHAVSQGALGVEVRADDSEALEMCKRISDIERLFECTAERTCLGELEGGCSVPVGMASEFVDGELKVTGTVTSVDGKKHVECTVKDKVKNEEEAEKLGVRLGNMLLDNGAKDILQHVSYKPL